jgi:hypothetical protein
LSGLQEQSQPADEKTIITPSPTGDKSHSSSSSSTSSSFVLVRQEEQDEETVCLPPGRQPEIKLIFLVSDATGVTARSTLLKSLAQFDDTCADENDHDVGGGGAMTCDVRTRTFTFIRSPQTLTQILNTAQDKGACVMYTLADPQLRKQAKDDCTAKNIPNVDLMGPSINVLTNFLDKTPLGIPARLSQKRKSRFYLGDSYYRRIDAVEFALKADDGQSPWLLPEADIVIVGVSRSGKTPLSVVLSQTMSLKVANIPLVMEVPPPSQLLDAVDPRRVFCLTIAPSELRKIRTNRLERRGVKEVEAKYNHEDSATASKTQSSKYADRNYLLRDLAHARQLSEQHSWTEIDVTGRAVEETATLIVELFNERFALNGTASSSISNQYVG